MVVFQGNDSYKNIHRLSNLNPVIDYLLSLKNLKHRINIEHWKQKLADDKKNTYDKV